MVEFASSEHIDFFKQSLHFSYVTIILTWHLEQSRIAITKCQLLLNTFDNQDLIANTRKKSLHLSKLSRAIKLIKMISLNILAE